MMATMNKPQQASGMMRQPTPAAETAYAITQRWLKACLLQPGSLFAGGSSVPASSLVSAEKLLTAFVGESTPDLAQIGNSWIPELVAIGTLERLDPWIEASREVDPEGYFPGIWDTNVIDGHVYGIPWYVDTRVLFYRTDLLAAAGVTAMPTTWSSSATSIVLTPTVPRPMGRTWSSEKRMDWPCFVATRNSRCPSVSTAARRWSPSSTFTPMMPFWRKFSYSVTSVFLIWPRLVSVTTYFPASIFGIGERRRY